MIPEPFRIGSRYGKAVELAAGEHVHPDDAAMRAHWLEVAGYLAEGHCPTCLVRLIRIERWAHCDACRTCWQLGQDHETGQPTISWMTDCHHFGPEMAPLFRIDDLRALHGKHGWPKTGIQ